MKLRKIFVGLLIFSLLFGLNTVASADDPDNQSSNNLPEAASNSLPPKGSFDPVPIHPVTDFLDPTTASVTHLELSEDDTLVVPAPVVLTPPTSQSGPPIKGDFGPGPLRMGYFDRETFHMIQDDASNANGLSNGNSGRSDLGHQNIGPASSTLIMSEDFESGFPPSGWDRQDYGGTGLWWDDVPCFPRNGAASLWAADDFSVSPSCASYVDNMNSWLVYGDFNLADAQSATLDFYFRLESESCCDGFSWLASKNGTNFYGYGTSGTYTTGLEGNGYNFASFDLTDVPGLGDLTGEPQVWVAFRFYSDSSITDRGPFIDDVTLRKNSGARMYITQEGFETSGGNSFPNSVWTAYDGNGTTDGEYYWDDVHTFQGPKCPSHSGTGSMWPADNGINGLDPCKSSPDNYPNDANSWLEYGPFNLGGADEAWVDFHFRNQSESCCDPFWWAASIDGSNYWGYYITGVYTGGPYGNGYNLRRFDLSNVPGLGDLRGESEVWLSFVFFSDFSVTGQGPFVDDVNVVKVANNQVFLPIIVKALRPPPVTLKIQNNTTGNVSFTVKNATLNGVSIGDLTCINLPPGGPYTCGATAIDQDKYTATAFTNCGNKTKEITISDDGDGTHTRTITCSGSPS